MGGAQSSAKGQGYHVLKVHENSPAHSLGIEPFFDYIVGINGLSLDTPSSFILQEQLYNNIDKKVILLIYSTKEQEFREVSLVPNKNWSSKLENGLIGCSIRYCSYESINEHVWHILDIAPDSPAEMAGLVPFTDYVIGSPHATLRGENDFYELVESNLGKPIRIYVYNADFDVCREVIIVPNHEWGGEGSLGCGVGYGYLHRIPKTNKFNNISPHDFELSWNNNDENNQDDYEDENEDDNNNNSEKYIIPNTKDTTENSSLTDNSTTISTNDFIADTNTDTTTFSDIPVVITNTDNIINSSNNNNNNDSNNDVADNKNIDTISSQLSDLNTTQIPPPNSSVSIDSNDEKN